MAEYASKGLANGVGIPALVLGSLGFLQSGGLGGLGGLFGNNMGCANAIAERDSLSLSSKLRSMLTPWPPTSIKQAVTS